MAPKHRILVVDDEQNLCELLEIVLESAGYEVRLANSVEAAQKAVEAEHFDTVLTDLRMGADKDAGMHLLAWLSENAPTIPAIMMTAHGSVDTAIEAMRHGALDYIQKPFMDNDEVRIRVKRAIEQQTLRRENEALRKEQARQGAVDEMIGKSPAFAETLSMVRRVAGLPSTVAIHGESGSGKELVARALHSLSNRAEKPFVAINCGGIPENLLESELFGYKKGAFTGAMEDKEGLFVVANGGTVFLDEIGEMPLMLQVKLLRVLDNNLVTPVGGSTTVEVDVRIISATNRNLEAMVEESTFRNDLYYRLNVIPVQVPPLRDRADDIPLLARHFLTQHARAMDRSLPELAPEAELMLCAYDWPGNVRELGNAIERAVALCTGDSIQAEDLPPNVRAFVPAAKAHDSILPAQGMDLEAEIEEIEREYIQQALERGQHSHIKTAELLGMTPRSLRYRLKKYDL